MARLFGLITKKPADFHFKIAGSEKRTAVKIHGWGIGGYDDLGKVQVKKGKRSTLSSDGNTAVEISLKASIIISHARVATSGAVSDTNAHPFLYKNYLFAHNGTINKEKISHQLVEPYNQDYQSEPIDSELFFRFLVQSINIEKNALSGIKKAVSLAKDARGANFILSDGKKMFAYCYGRPLYFLRRKPFTFLAVSKETGITYECSDLNYELSFLVCSERLTDENWIRFDEDELVYCDKLLNYETYKLS